MYNILGITGPSGCGKDTAAGILTNNYNNCHYVKLCTTRPQRNELDNNYYFLSSEEFLVKVLNGSMLNAQEFRGWYYGLSKEELQEDKINIMPMNNIMVEQMIEENLPNINLNIIYIDTDEKERLLHILNRENCPDCAEVCRRYLTDINDYCKNIDLINNCKYSIFNKYDKSFNTVLFDTYESFYLNKDKTI